MGIDKKILMNTTVFSNIVDDIAYSAAECLIDKDSVLAVDKIAGTDTMRKLSVLLDEELDNSIEYKEHASFSLPYALGTLRDSMILQDKYASNSLKTRATGGGNA